MSSLHEMLARLVMEPGIWGAVGLFLVSGVDELAAPIPSSLVLVGELLFLKDPITLANLGKLTAFVGAPIALGTTVGSFIIYWIAYAGGKPAYEKLKTKLRISSEKASTWSGKFQDKWYDELLFFFFRATPLMPTMPVTLVAGAMRMKPWKYAVLTFLGILVRVLITLVILRTGANAVFKHAVGL